MTGSYTTLAWKTKCNSHLCALRETRTIRLFHKLEG
uniref:Uncharacterized protein n=1 Tax=Anguilla anguilla TaxID=7936 RepID=A0A0E9XRD7_ANGAN